MGVLLPLPFPLCNPRPLASPKPPSLIRFFHPFRVQPIGRPRIAQLRILCPPALSRFTALFRFGKRGLDAENAGIYGSQGRDDFDRDDVEQYFNYMGMLATEGSYDKMEALVSKDIHPVDILLLLAASEGDKPKIEELLRAGANYSVTDVEGRTALDRAQNDDIRQLILTRAQAPA